jgi:hypothetical protein
MLTFHRWVCTALVCAAMAAPLHAAHPASPEPFPNPFKRTPFSAEVEIYSGGISGDHIGAAYHSITRGDYGVRFTFGFMKALNFSLNYMYSNQSRTLIAATPAAGALPSGTAIARAANLNVFFGNGEINLIHRKHAIFYLSPGVGFARNGSRSVSLVTPLGVASAPIGPGTSISFNLGTGVKIYPRKHLGFRIDVRDFVSGGGTGNLNSSATCPASVSGGTCLSSIQQYFGSVPVQNNLVLTLGLIFKFI